MVRLNKKYLQIDYKGVSNDNIVYTILASDGQPKYGEVVLMPMPADSPLEGLDPSLLNEQGFTATTSFTQQDVNDGTVWYHHFGRSTSSDSFQFQKATDVTGTSSSSRISKWEQRLAFRMNN
ncbi:Extracellular matrix protein FRAS1 Precursor [Channa argus]|uniref:Extracellular matrix protein FRAS1 n=1 Tax=Channa argus TaxID=215402 RepID=A0A6G1PYD7_CHAAH|nr:Extracellular matrix protein FRAS1 Precursor [Channa argus]